MPYTMMLFSPCTIQGAAAEKVQQEANIKQQLQYTLLRHLAGEHPPAEASCDCICAGKSSDVIISQQCSTKPCQ